MFGVVGSGNYDVAAALTGLGVKYVTARHETGAAVVADVYGRSTGEVAAVSLHPCGLNNAIAGIAEAAKSRTPMLVMVGETPATQPGSKSSVSRAAMSRNAEWTEEKEK